MCDVFVRCATCDVPAMNEFSWGKAGRARLWVEEAHPGAFHPDAVLSTRIEGQREWSAPNRTAVIEASRVTGGRTHYGLLGLRCISSNEGVLSVSVGWSNVRSLMQDSIRGEYEPVYLGLTQEFAPALESTQARMAGPSAHARGT